MCPHVEFVSLVTHSQPSNISNFMMVDHLLRRQDISCSVVTRIANISGGILPTPLYRSSLNLGFLADSSRLRSLQIFSVG